LAAQTGTGFFSHVYSVRSGSWTTTYVKSAGNDKETYDTLEFASWTGIPQQDASAIGRNSRGQSNGQGAHGYAKEDAIDRRYTAHWRSQLEGWSHKRNSETIRAPIMMASWKLPTQVDPNSLRLRHLRHIVASWKTQFATGTRTETAIWRSQLVGMDIGSPGNDHVTSCHMGGIWGHVLVSSLMTSSVLIYFI
jgi:hypothetical protein